MSYISASITAALRCTASTLAPPTRFLVPGAATQAQIEKERAEAKAREERELSERLAQSQGSEPRESPTPSRLTPIRFPKPSLSTDSPTKKTFDPLRPSPVPQQTPSRSHSAKSSPVFGRSSSHDPSPSLFRRQNSRDVRPEAPRGSMSFGGFSQSQSASAPATNVGADIVSILAEELSFKALSQGAEGPTKLKILPQPWSTDSVPPASATLFSIASKPGLLAAAGPDTLVLASTEKVRNAFKQKPGEWDVISDFAPDASMPVPALRHVAFSSEGDFLVISAEDGGGLAVFDPRQIMKQNFKPGNEISTDKQPIRALLPNPTPEMEHIFAAVLDSGKLVLIDVAKGATHPIREEGVMVASWSTKGKAIAVGLKDGTGVLYLNDGTVKGVIPRPPSLNEGFTYSGLVWLANDEFFITHFPKKSAIDTGEPEEGKYHYVRSNKGWTSFSFHPTTEEPILPAWDMPTRPFPPRLSATRLRGWEPDLDDLLIVTNSHTDTIVTVTSANKELARGGPINEYTMTEINEGQGAQVPRRVFGEEGDSVLIGEALDLSATEKLLRPISSNEEITEAPHPLPAYMFLTYQGILSAYWIVWNRSIVEGKGYPGLVNVDDVSSASNTQTSAPKTALSSKIPTSGSGNNAPATPAGPKFGASPFGSTTPATAFGKSAFGTPASSTPFGQAPPKQPAFGAPSAVGSASPFGQKPAFGTPSAVGSSTPFGQTSKQPAFGAPSAVGSASPFGQVAGSTFGQTSKPSGTVTGSTQPAFGTPAGPGKASPWGTSSPQTSSTPAGNPFASGGASSGFAKFGANAPGSGSGFASFGNTSGTQSGFAGLGQQKSAFGGASNNAPAPKTEQSFGSTVTIGSNNGSTLSSWGSTPQQQSSIFGQKTTNSSFATGSSFASTDSGPDSQQRKRDEATPTPQTAGGLNGLAGGFKLGTTFQADPSAKTEDAAKPAAPTQGGFFGSDFSSMVPKAGLQPSKGSGDGGSTTPLSPAKKTSYFGTTPSAPSPVKKEPVDDAPLPPDFTKATKKSEPVEDAPLPPDFTTFKPKSQPEDAPLPPDFISKKSSKEAEDDVPPLAGSPGVEVEPSLGNSPTPFTDDEEEDEEFSSEEEYDEEGEEGEEEDDEGEEEEEEEEEEEDENEKGRQQPTTLGKYVLQQPGNNASTDKPATTSQPSLFGAKPFTSQAAPSSLFGAKPASQPTGSQSLFGQPTPLSLGQQAKPSFPTPRAQETLRSPSPVRSSSSSNHRPTTRREPSMPGNSLSASFQQSKRSTPQVTDLEDQEDERIRAQLAQPIEPSRTLDEFVAHQKYAAASDRTGHAAQIEAIYKDINGMVDALGWNARSIKSFTEWHKQPQPNHMVDRQAMEDVGADGKDGPWFDQFALCEIKGLKNLEDELSKDLEAGRIQDVHDKLSQLRRLILEKAKLMTRINDIRRQIINRKDPERLESSRKAALPKELADTQKTLRAEYAKLLTLLSQAEEATILLRSRLASHNASGGNTSAVPSMDAVKKTIIKMTTMAERKNNDIALLESQLRKLGLQDPSRPTSSSSPANGATTPRRSRGTDLRRSIADTPFATPPTKGKMSLTELNRRALTPEVKDDTPSKGYGLFYDAQETTTGTELLHLSNMVDDSIKELCQTARTRRTVASGLRKVLLERGVKTTTVV